MPVPTPPPLTRIAQIGLGTRLVISEDKGDCEAGMLPQLVKGCKLQSLISDSFGWKAIVLTYIMQGSLRAEHQQIKLSLIKSQESI